MFLQYLLTFCWRVGEHSVAAFSVSKSYRQPSEESRATLSAPRHSPTSGASPNVPMM